MKGSSTGAQVLEHALARAHFDVSSVWKYAAADWCSVLQCTMYLQCCTASATLQPRAHMFSFSVDAVLSVMHQQC